VAWVWVECRSSNSSGVRSGLIRGV
jgi:hypothetical protein